VSKSNVGRFLVMMGLLLTFKSVARAQSATGTPPFGSFSGGPDVINNSNLNIMIDIPIQHKAGRGLPFMYDLVYNSLLWSSVSVSGVQTWQPAINFGWTAQTDALVGFASNTKSVKSCVNSLQQPSTETVYSNYVFHDRLGIGHPYVGTANSGCGTDGAFTGFTETASDGSGYTITTGRNQFTVTITTRDGHLLTLPLTNGLSGIGTVTDTNGNQLSVNGSGVFTDTLGQTALTVAGSGTASSPITFTYTAPSGVGAQIVQKYETVNVKTSFGCSGIAEYSATNMPLVSEIDLADSGTNPNDKYTVTYEETVPGVPGTVTGRIASITLPTGGQITYAYPTGSAGIECSDGSTAALTRTTPDGTWTYSRVLGTAAASTTTVLDPQNDETVLNFQGIYETERQIHQGTSSLLKTITTCYNGATTPCNSTAITLPISQTLVTVQWPGGLQSSTDSLFNSLGLVTKLDESGYGSGTPGGLIRTTSTNYASLGNGIGSQPSLVTRKDGTGLIVSQTGFCYDEAAPSGSFTCGAAGSPAATTGTPQHVSVTGSRGNLTSTVSVVQGSAVLAQTFTRYDTGNLLTSKDTNGAQTTYVYGTGSCGNSFATSVNEPLSLTKSMVWSCTGGVQTSVTDENGQPTTVVYNDADFWRPHSVTDPSLAVSTLTYTGPTSVESSTPLNGTSTSDALITLDTLGRARLIQVKQGPTSANYDTQETDYNAAGLPLKYTIPFQGTAGTINTSASGVTTTYDGMGRPLTATDSGAGVTTYSYSNNDVLITSGPHPTGENAKSKQYEYDALGRLTSVCEITAGAGVWLGGSCNQNTAATGYLTKYAYDANDNLTGVTQNAQSTATQTRAYAYDDLGRLTSEQNPETGATSYVYDSDTTCTPASAGDLVKKTDHATNVICYAYDGLHRVTNISYVSGPNASATPTKHFVYDAATVNSVAMTNGKSRLVEAYTCTACPTPITDLGFSYSVRGQVSAVYEKTPHSVSYYSMAASYWANGALDQIGGIPGLPMLSYTPDGEGRPAMVTASSSQNPMLVTNTSYTPASQPVTMTFGTGDSDSFTYDSATDRMTQFKATINTQSLTGTIGWNAVGTPASLGIVDAFNASDTQNCTFGHDDLVRIAAVNCGTLWGQNFAYDPFGNVDKAVISGDAGINFQANYSSSTNQISSLPGFTPTYDLDGNLKSDSAHTYTWNSEARPVTIDSVTLVYDALNRIVEQGNGSTFTETVYSPLGAKFGLMNGQTLVKAFAVLPDGAVAAYTPSGLAYYRHPDWLGSSRLASTPSRTIYADAAYAPFGEAYSQSGATDLSFTGQDQDTVPGLFDFLYREYSSTQGRWVSPDPAGLAATDINDPQSWNRYAYVRNTPLIFVDQTGLVKCRLRSGITLDIPSPRICVAEGGTILPDDPPDPCAVPGSCGNNPGGSGPGGGGGQKMGPAHPKPKPCRVIDPVLGALELKVKMGPEIQLGKFKVGLTLYKNLSTGQTGGELNIDLGLAGITIDNPTPDGGNLGGTTEGPQFIVNFAGYEINFTTGEPGSWQPALGAQALIGVEGKLNSNTFNTLSKSNDICRANGGA
jgi:RHS repeat-associated protein